MCIGLAPGGHPPFPAHRSSGVDRQAELGAVWGQRGNKRPSLVFSCESQGGAGWQRVAQASILWGLRRSAVHQLLLSEPARPRAVRWKKENMWNCGQCLFEKARYEWCANTFTFLFK